MRCNEAARKKMIMCRRLRLKIHFCRLSAAKFGADVIHKNAANVIRRDLLKSAKDPRGNGESIQ